MSDTGRLYQFFSHLFHTIAKEDGEGSGESTFAAFVEKIMQQTCIRGIFVNNRRTNVSRKKTGTLCAKLKRARGKVRVSVSRAVTDEWRDAIFSVRLLYHELGNYFIENER